MCRFMEGKVEEEYCVEVGSMNGIFGRMCNCNVLILNIIKRVDIVFFE